VLGFETEADAKTAARLIKRAQARSADEKSGAEALHSKKSQSESAYMECGGLTPLFLCGFGGYWMSARFTLMSSLTLMRSERIRITVW